MRICIAAFLVMAGISAGAQSTSPDLSPGYYVVVASYLAGQQDYATSFSEKLNKSGGHSYIGYDPGRKFIHVYLDKYDEFDQSIREMNKARSAGHSTAWVRIMRGDRSTDTPVATSTPHVEVKPTTPANPVEIKPATETASIPVQSSPVVAKEPMTQVEANPSPADVTATAVPPVETVAVSDPMIHPKMLKEGKVELTLFNPTNNEQVDGDIEIVDADRSKLITKAKANDQVVIPDPKNNTGKISFKATSFGYRPTEHTLNYKSSEKDSLPDYMDVEDNHYRMRFEMVRLRRGDIAVLYNVYFYNDAAVMIPDSKYELGKLLQLMNDNKGYRIKLHGHTNGNASGKIISLGPSKNFFSLNADVKQGYGSAKELSRQRAQTIKDWLVSNGIAENRVEVQAHGGSRMIHDKNSPNAKRNVRVEVEMLSE